MEKALLVTVRMESEKEGRQLEEMAVELQELASTSGVEILDNIQCTCERPTPSLFIGKGKAEEIAWISEEEKAQTVIFNRDLSGTQQRNLEKVVGKKIIDRTQLILDIFAKHAKSPEGKMQVELAQLQYLLPRLIGQGVILSRTGGGIGTSGPGEQQLETDRRRIREKIDRLKRDIKHLANHRVTMRAKRKKSGVLSVALVGYTNAGKSTLLNSLTKSSQVVADSLFTTLDPLSKSLVLPGGEHVVVSDTVGFLHGLPHHLIEAFKATLEEVAEADLLVHVLDASHPSMHDYYEDTMQVLKGLGLEDKPVITALNKIDLLEDRSWLNRFLQDFPRAVAISARTGENFKVLLKEIEETFAGRMVNIETTLPHGSMDLVNLLYREGRVEEVKYLQKGIKIKANLPKALYQKLLHDNKLQ